MSVQIDPKLRVSAPVWVLAELMAREAKLNLLEAAFVQQWERHDLALDGWTHDERVRYFAKNILDNKKFYPEV